MRFVGIGVLGLLSVACGGLRFPDGPAPSGFRAAEVVDAIAYGAFPALQKPRQSPVAAVDPADTEPLAVLSAGRDVRAYPLSILLWHEVVNDTVGGIPIAVTYGPYTDTPAAWDRRTAAGRTLTLEASGKVYAGSLLLTDRQTRSLWLQPTGVAVAGPLKGQALTPVALALLPAGRYRGLAADGTLIDPQTGFDRPYGRTPYRGYDGRRAAPPRLFLRSGDRRLPPMSRVLAVPTAGAGAVAYPFDAIRRERLIVDGDRVVIWVDGVASALDAPIVARGRDAGSAVAYERVVAGRLLTFTATATGMRDDQTASAWDLLGRAIAGPMKGQALRRVPAIRSFWFAWSALDPGIQVYGPAPEG